MNKPSDTECWVFGYGSLIWNPGFKYRQARVARLYGYHRSFCLYSVRYRGTVDYPGLVLALDRGGSCWGMAFDVAPEDQPEALAYLDDRETMMGSYFRKDVTLNLRAETHDDPEQQVAEQQVPGVTYVINRDYNRYAPKLDEREVVERLATAVGPNGPNRTYLFETHDSLQTMGLKDRYLSRLRRKVLDFEASTPAEF